MNQLNTFMRAHRKQAAIVAYLFWLIAVGVSVADENLRVPAGVLAGLAFYIFIILNPMPYSLVIVIAAGLSLSIWIAVFSAFLKGEAIFPSHASEVFSGIAATLIWAGHPIWMKSSTGRPDDRT